MEDSADSCTESKLLSYGITNRFCSSSPTPSPLLDITFNFIFEFERVRDQDSPVLNSRRPKKFGSYVARTTTVDQLSFEELRDSIAKALEDVELHDRHRDELITFAWDTVHSRFGTETLTNKNIVVIDIVGRVSTEKSGGDGCLKESSCSICLEDFSGGLMLLVQFPVCSHIFHLRCINEWRRTSCFCPLCRRDVSGCESCDGWLRVAIDGSFCDV